MSELELGQLVLSNNNWEDHDAYWATSGLNMIAEVIAEYENKGKRRPKYGFPTLTGNNGGEFVNDVFEMRAYCWCDGYGEHENGCPPNFFYKPTGVVMSWYKHAGRGITCNKPEPSASRWFEVIDDCIKSIRGEANE